MTLLGPQVLLPPIDEVVFADEARSKTQAEISQPYAACSAEVVVGVSRPWVTKRCRLLAAVTQTSADVAVETGDTVLMKSDPADVLAAITLFRATVRRMKQNLFWAAIYDVVAIPICTGAMHPSLRVMLQPEFGALAMSASSITVVTNALLVVT